ncbi:MFS polyamine transporter [Mycena venus]|uniref:MFS polyamine transporter n=1 Tax=Mycena venus TaxID=2733690 RepID=A0A8H7CME5_9AGAR|nr:MFS polyamine transporter [Mycena venus]
MNTNVQASTGAQSELLSSGDSSVLEPLLVDWDGSDDQENPRNWTSPRKWLASIIIASLTFISPLTSSIVSPASDLIAAEFGLTNSVAIALFTSIFLLAYAFGPLVIGPLSELYGRRVIVQTAGTWYIAWNLGCSFAQNTPQLLVFRFLAGLGGSAMPAIGGATVGDIWAPSERGRPMAIYSLTVLLGPALGPTCGAWIAEKSTWRWVFWGTTMAAATLQVLALLFLPESYAPFLLESKAAKIRQSLSSDHEKGNGKVREVLSKYPNENRTLTGVLRVALVRPFNLLFAESIVQLLGLLYGIRVWYFVPIPHIHAQNVSSNLQ